MENLLKEFTKQTIGLRQSQIYVKLSLKMKRFYLILWIIFIRKRVNCFKLNNKKLIKNHLIR